MNRQSTTSAAALLIAAVLFPGGQAAFGQATKGPPAPPANGPSQTMEQYLDWVVGCASVANGAKRCSMWQVLSEEKSKQQVVRPEILPATADGTHLMRVDLPFGISIAEGATLLVDGQPAHKLAVLTCAPPRGCISEISLTATTMPALKQATALAVRFKAYNEGAADPTKSAPLTFNLSVKGLPAALDRLAVVAK